MKAYTGLTKEELLQEKESLERAYADYQKRGLSLNMARGKPAPEQLDLSMDILSDLDAIHYIDFDSGFDIRNYGCLDGLKRAKDMLSSMVGCNAKNVIVAGNSSLNLMFDQVARGMSTGFAGEKPWATLEKKKWLCPVPGYDRHFAITEHFGFEMINIPMKEDGPDMDLVEKYVKDESVKGIWCVPKYSNPEGVVYSDAVVRRFAKLKPKAKDFRIFWDNAYAVHHLYESPSEQAQILDIIALCEEAGNPDLVFEFMSTSKITFAGGGISGIASSPANKKEILDTMKVQTIGFDKVNQMRHVRFFRDMDAINAHMMKHAEILRPKFECVLQSLSTELEGRDCGSWTHPLGGYFITYKTLDGCATRVIALCKDCGVTLTGAGAPFPYHHDESDSYIRIAPSYPTLSELNEAMKIFVICVKLATVEKLLEA